MLTVIKEFLFSGCLTETDKKLAKPNLNISDALRAKLSKLGSQSLAIRQVDAGSSNDCEHEIAALENPIYDFNRFGFKIVASPRHADILLVTGPVAPGMKNALIKTYEATPQPSIVIAVGDGAISGRICNGFGDSSLSKVSDCIPVDLEIPGDPPSPAEILAVLLTLRSLDERG